MSSNVTLRYSTQPIRYARFAMGEAIPSGESERLPDGCEVFELVAPSASDAQRVLDALSCLGGIHHIMRRDAALTIEYIGDLFLLFDMVESIGIPISRRALVPLEDASLVAIANVVWRDGELHENRILERAAATP